jgi:protein-S-isoprenylcysteine O-methyltransferase Ste14
MKIGRTNIRRIIFALVACSLLLFRGVRPGWFIAGSALMFLGEIIQLSSYSVLVKRAELTTTGPYQFVRNPFYVGTILKDLGVCVISGNPFIMLAYVVFFLPVLFRRIEKEERFLRDKFGQQFEEYTQLVPRLLPHLSAWPKLLTGQGNIEPYLILKNRIFPRILNLWAFIIAIVVISNVRWKAEPLWSVSHLALLAVCVVMLYASFILNKAGKRLKQEEKLQKTAA